MDDLPLPVLVNSVYSPNPLFSRGWGIDDPKLTLVVNLSVIGCVFNRLVICPGCTLPPPQRLLG